MRLIRYLLGSVVTTLVLILLVIAGVIGYRYATFSQTDNNARLEGKYEYLQRLSALQMNLADAPNIIFILYDDMGYGDIGAGARESALIDTPNIDALAEGGVSFSNFYSPSPVCTPSRAGYLTGRLAPRAGLPYVVFPSGSKTELLASMVMNPGENVRLPAEEITVAEVLRAAGYRTGMIGKWHLGDVSPSLPNDMGFDSYFGALYSNDMKPFALYRNRDIAVPAPADQRYLTEQYTREALSFIAADDGRFFLYFAHNFPHDPLHVREERMGKSSGGLYGDVLEEIDEGIGDLVEELEQSGRLDNTLIIIASDNGPWFLGNAGDQRGRKGNTFEGGMRVPFIAHWPERIPGGRTESAIAMGIDILPTVLDILDLPAPLDRVIDGRSVLGTLQGGADSPHDYLYYLDGKTLFAVRDQRFKYRGPAHVHYATDETPMAFGVPQKEWLFDLENDPRESYDTSDRHPEALSRLRQEFRRKQAEMASNPRGWVGG